MASPFGLYVRWRRGEPREGRLFRADTIKHTPPFSTSAGELICVACGHLLTETGPVALFILGPGNDPDDQRAHAEGRWYTAAAILVHSACIGDDRKADS